MERGGRQGGAAGPASPLLGQRVRDELLLFSFLKKQKQEQSHGNGEDNGKGLGDRVDGNRSERGELSAGRCLGSNPARGVADWSSGRSARDELLQDTGTRKGVREEEGEREERAGAHGDLRSSGEAFVPGSFEEARRWGRPMLCSVVLWPGLSGGGGCGIGWIEGRRRLARC